MLPRSGSISEFSEGSETSDSASDSGSTTTVTTQRTTEIPITFVPPPTSPHNTSSTSSSDESELSSCLSALSYHTKASSTRLSTKGKEAEEQMARPRTAAAQAHAEETTVEKGLRVLVVGAGLGGLSAAIACARQGFRVTVLERGEGLSLHGDSITIGCNASKLLLRWGMGPELLQQATPSGWSFFFDDQGVLVREDDLRDHAEVYGAPVLQGHRGHFFSTLATEAIRAGVTVRLNTEVVEYWDLPTCPAIVTASGEVVEADVLLVADGVGGAARELLAESFGRTTGASIREGYSVWRGAVSNEGFLEDEELWVLVDGNQRFWVGDDCHATLATIAEGRMLSFTFMHRDPRRKATLDPSWDRTVGEVLPMLEGWDPLLIRAVKEFKTVLNWRVTEADPAEEWVTSGGKIAFLGDNVHSLLPTSYQGGSQAIEDAATLAISLALVDGCSDDIRLSLKTYQSIRRERVKSAQAVGREQRDLWHSFSSTGNRNPASLAFLGFDAFFTHDAEKHAVASFEETAKTMNGEFELAAGRKQEVLERLGIVAGGREGAAGGVEWGVGSR